MSRHDARVAHPPTSGRAMGGIDPKRILRSAAGARGYVDVMWAVACIVSHGDLELVGTCIGDEEHSSQAYRAFKLASSALVYLRTDNMSMLPLDSVVDALEAIVVFEELPERGDFAESSPAALRDAM